MDNGDTLFDFLESAAVSDIGRRRKRNEDSVAHIPSHGVFCIADGMGGEDAGDVASQATVREVVAAMDAMTDLGERSSAQTKGDALDRALRKASEWIRKRSEEQGRGLSGSTVVVLTFDAARPAHGVALHAGDSRIYRLRKKDLEQLTRDHSMAEESGLSKSQMPKMFRGMVTRAVGISENLQLARAEVEVREGDLFLLCSDGLSGMLSHKKIRRLLLRHDDKPVATLAENLVAAANDAGGEDNISAILVRVGSFPPPVPVADAKPAEAKTDTDLLTPATAERANAEPVPGEEDECERETAETALLAPGAADRHGRSGPNDRPATGETLPRAMPKPHGLFGLFSGKDKE